MARVPYPAIGGTHTSARVASTKSFHGYCVGDSTRTWRRSLPIRCSGTAPPAIVHSGDGAPIGSATSPPEPGPTRTWSRTACTSTSATPPRGRAAGLQTTTYERQAPARARVATASYAMRSNSASSRTPERLRIDILEPRRHRARDGIHRAAAERVVRLALQQRAPGRAQKRRTTRRFRALRERRPTARCCGAATAPCAAARRLRALRVANVPCSAHV